ncbi:MAG: carboxypeptidase-like regulatory domain-containing protein, partial [Winogradskyella sp.]|nr:carboxypeptidase-like regulatory domain-containing protein [Winogradskyella sp.]
TGGRTYFSQNDQWRLEGFLAYGLKDDKFKYGISGKWLLDKKSRFIISGGNRRDVEQIGASLTNTTDVLGRSLASSSLIGTGANDKLTTVNLTTLAIESEPLKNMIVRLSGTYRTLESASPTFSLDYFTDETQTTTESEVKQYETAFSVFVFPNREMTGYGVERRTKNSNFATLFAQLTIGDKNFFNSDFNYTKLQLSYTQPYSLGSLGRLTTTLQAGKTFGQIPLGLLSVVPGNQTYFNITNSFSNLDFYEFVTDEYATLHLEHNFNGRLFSRIPFLKKYNLRAIVGFRGVIGDVSQENRAINASGLVYDAPNREPYYEYSLGVSNIFKILRLDFNFRGNYLDNPDARPFGVTASFGFFF